MNVYYTPTGSEAVHIGYNPEVGKEVFRVGDELVYTKRCGCVGDIRAILICRVIVLFADGTYHTPRTQEELDALKADEAFWKTELVPSEILD